MIEFENVTKIIRKTVVSDLSFKVEEGETLVILGRSGSGKTSSLKMVNRLIDPTKGIIRIKGEDIATLDPIKLRRTIGYVVQEIGLFPHMTISENIALVPRMLRQHHIGNRVDQLLEMVGLDPKEYGPRYPKELSGGQRQRVGVARALAADPPIILMDEPFGALDPLTREEIRSELIRLKERIGKTMLFVTHDIEEALKVGDRIAIMERGKLLQLATPNEFKEEQQMPFVERFLAGTALR